MALFPSRDRRAAEAIAELTYSNPFRERRIELEHAALGADYDGRVPPWNQRGELIDDHPNIVRLVAKGRAIVDAARAALRAGRRGDERERSIYEDLVVFLSYYDWRERFEFDPDDVARRARSSRRRHKLAAEFEAYLASYLGPEVVGDDASIDVIETAAHLLACFYQVNRAFRSIFRCIIGVSRPTARFRAEVWESIFTRDLRRYRTSLYRSMSDIVTLVTGPSGSGKELAARAIGLSRYIPLDRSTGAFDEPGGVDVADSFYPLNLSALSPTLIESELFGHRRGAFTGAIADRAGWFEECPALGTIFLDEIGELDPAIQVKLLRVLQSRTFQRIGESRERRFRGKLVAATNRDLVRAMRDGELREDFYYRLCADMIEAPSLASRVADDPQELETLVRFVAGRLLPGVDGALAAEVADETLRFVRERLGLDYAWPGNVRELEQVVRNVLVRGSYRPVPAATESDEAGSLAAAMRDCSITADALLRRYCAIAYRKLGSLEETGRVLDLDRRTVRGKVGG
ncbi:MAG: sigma-54-dependent Fis family transcriptional regulator [Phycisphaerae bacterium]|nr:sigma-54-dependent Fis family transcriptional regulator [Phycisphaerae bacterium]